MENKEKVRPGRQFYIIGLIMIIVSIFYVVMDNSNALNNLTANSQTFTAPGKTQITVEKAGRYGIMFWRKTDGKAIQSLSSYANLKFTVLEKSTGKTIPVMLLTGGLHEFDAARGAYLITADYPKKAGPTAEMRIVYATIPSEELIGFGVFLVLAVGGIILLINTAVRRRKCLHDYYLR